MDKDEFMRRVLWLSVPFNLVGALLFAFPSSPVSRFAGFPAPVPALYSTLLAFFILLFGGTYAWLALQPTIDRPLVAFCAIGKAGFFALMVVFWWLGQVPGQAVLGAGGDLAFAGIFAWWLLTT